MSHHRGRVRYGCTTTYVRGHQSSQLPTYPNSLFELFIVMRIGSLVEICMPSKFISCKPNFYPMQVASYKKIPNLYMCQLFLEGCALDSHLSNESSWQWWKKNWISQWFVLSIHQHCDISTNHISHDLLTTMRWSLNSSIGPSIEAVWIATSKPWSLSSIHQFLHHHAHWILN